MTLTQFLTARLDEDETAARLRASYIGRPLRVLAEVDAKRRIVSLCAPTLGDALTAAAGEWDEAAWKGKQVLCALALPYADHPDYDEEWRP